LTRISAFAPLDIGKSRKRKVFKRQPTASYQEVIAVDLDDREKTALQERRYTRLLTEGCFPNLPATTSSPFGAPVLACDEFFFRHLHVLRERLAHLLDSIEHGRKRVDADIMWSVIEALHSLLQARQSSIAWCDLHSIDKDLITRAERVLSMSLSPNS
jgi:hypothetical protein